MPEQLLLGFSLPVSDKSNGEVRRVHFALVQMFSHQGFLVDRFFCQTQLISKDGCNKWCDPTAGTERLA
jgi:hypothetical protein